MPIANIPIVSDTPSQINAEPRIERSKNGERAAAATHTVADKGNT